MYGLIIDNEIMLFDVFKVIKHIPLVKRNGIKLLSFTKIEGIDTLIIDKINDLSIIKENDYEEFLRKICIRFLKEQHLLF